jgi:hypothetical protein
MVYSSHRKLYFAGFIKTGTVNAKIIACCAPFPIPFAAAHDWRQIMNRYNPKLSSRETFMALISTLVISTTLLVTALGPVQASMIF